VFLATSFWKTSSSRVAVTLSSTLLHCTPRQQRPVLTLLYPAAALLLLIACWLLSECVHV
jgi:hypothetical protein